MNAFMRCLCIVVEGVSNKTSTISADSICVCEDQALHTSSGILTWIVGIPINLAKEKKSALKNHGFTPPVPSPEYKY